MCKCSHRVETITVNDTNVVLTVSNSTNIGNYAKFDFYFPKCKSLRRLVTGEPLAVLINVNGENVPLYNRYSIALLSDRVPRRSCGTYIVPESGSAYVILHNTPFCKPRV